jgi:hypothetical protein
MREFLSAPAWSDGQTPVQIGDPCDQGRIRLIEQDFKPLLADYLEDRIVLSDFKSKVDGINKHNSFWGFKVIKGQRFFNMVVNVADAPEFCTLGAVLNPAVLGELLSQAFKETEGYMPVRGIRRVSSQLGATCQSVKGCGACS